MRTLSTALLLSLGATAASAFEAPLVEPADLAPGSEDAPTILDIRAAEDFAGGHIPGAVNIPYAAFRGPADNPGRVPELARLEATFEAAGLSPDAEILVVHEGRNASDFGAAARVYWTLKSTGFADLAILNGGFNAFVEMSGADISTTPVEPAPTDLSLNWTDTWTVDAADIEATIAGEAEHVLIDARPADFFEGRQKHDAAPQAGTLPGALNFVNFAWFADEGPRIDYPEATLQSVRAIAAENEGKPIVSFCNTGHWAATNWFAVSELAGIENVKLYPESMVGWTQLGNVAVAGSAGN